MVNLTASMAVAVRGLAASGFRPRGDLIYFAVDDEESGSRHGAQWLADYQPDAIRADYALTENGGLHSGSSEAPFIGMNVGEKGVAWRRLQVRGVPGHGSAPFRTSNSLVKAAAVVQRLSTHAPAVRFHELWRAQLDTMPLTDEAKSAMLDPSQLDDLLAAMPNAGIACHLHACTHTTFSCNVLEGSMKTNVIPDTIDIGVDIRTLPGETDADVQAHLDVALGELAADVEVNILMNDAATISRIDTPMWDSLQRAVAYGAGLFSPELDAGEFGSRFHDNDERVDVESLRLTTQLWLDVVHDMLG